MTSRMPQHPTTVTLQERSRVSLTDTHFHHFGFLFCTEQVRDFSRVEEGVHILEERLFLDLAIGDKEHCLLVGQASCLEQALNVLAPLILAILLRDLWLEDVHARHECSEARERLATTAADSHQQSIAASNAQDAADT